MQGPSLPCPEGSHCSCSEWTRWLLSSLAAGRAGGGAEGGWGREEEWVTKSKNNNIKCREEKGGSGGRRLDVTVFLNIHTYTTLHCICHDRLVHTSQKIFTIIQTFQ